MEQPTHMASSTLPSSFPRHPPSLPLSSTKLRRTSTHPSRSFVDRGREGDVVGSAAAAGDVELLGYCLEELGHVVNGGMWYNALAVDAIQMAFFRVPGKNGQEVRLLKAHGATAKKTFDQGVKEKEER